MPKETAAGERRVALVPEAVGRLTRAGFDVVVEAGAGEAAAFPDAEYTGAAAQVVSAVAYGSLKITNANGVSAPSSFDVSGTLTMNGASTVLTPT